MFFYKCRTQFAQILKLQYFLVFKNRILTINQNFIISVSLKPDGVNLHILGISFLIWQNPQFEKSYELRLQRYMVQKICHAHKC